MGFKERFNKVLKAKGDERGWAASIVSTGKISQAVLSKMISGKTASPTLDNVAAVIDAIGIEAFLDPSVIKRTGTNSPAVPIVGDDLVAVPVVSGVGAGTPWNTNSSAVERYISVPKEYDNENVVSLRVEGDSMEPTIMKGGFIGVVPFTAPLVEGEMYVVHLPYFGDVVKRVRMGDNVGEIVLLSDNPHYPPQHVPLDGHDDLIRGRVIWSISSYVKN